MSRTILIPFVILFFIRFFLAAVFPVFGDEAYYLFWGTHPAGGYYDLPPMIGWWLGPLLKVSTHPLWLRIWNLLVPLMIAFGIYEWLIGVRGRTAAALVALVFFSLPLPYLTVISFPDVPLLFFCFFSALLFQSGVSSQKRFISAEVVMSGALFGAAFLSKYFAVFFLPAFVLWAWNRSRRKGGLFVSFFAGSAPFLIQHLIWNEDHCRANAIFNLVTRQQAYDGTVASTTGFFLLHLFGVSFTIIPFLKHTRSNAEPPAEQGLRSFFLMLWLIPVLIFLLTALMGRGQGLHWLLFLTPFFVIWASFRLPVEGLRRAFFASALVSSGVALFLAFAFVSPERMIPLKIQDRYPFDFAVITEPRPFVEKVKALLGDTETILFESYGLASLIHYEFLRFGGPSPVPAFGVVSSGSRFGRVFDFSIDWKALEGKSVALLKTGKFDPNRYHRYFQKTEEVPFFHKGAEVSILKGSGFDARRFWLEQVMPELERFYPREFTGKCSLKEVYRAD